MDGADEPTELWLSPLVGRRLDERYRPMSSADMLIKYMKTPRTHFMNGDILICLTFGPIKFQAAPYMDSLLLQNGTIQITHR